MATKHRTQHAAGHEKQAVQVQGSPGNGWNNRTGVALNVEQQRAIDRHTDVLVGKAALCVSNALHYVKGTCRAAKAVRKMI